MTLRTRARATNQVMRLPGGSTTGPMVVRQEGQGSMSIELGRKQTRKIPNCIHKEIW